MRLRFGFTARVISRISSETQCGFIEMIQRPCDPRPSYSGEGVTPADPVREEGREDKAAPPATACDIFSA